LRLLNVFLYNMNDKKTCNEIILVYNKRIGCSRVILNCLIAYITFI